MSRPTIVSSFVAGVVTLAACGETVSPTRPMAGVPPNALAGKQGTTSSKILYQDIVGNFQVFSMDEDGTNAVQLTSGPGSAAGPTWAPDGKRVVFRGADFGSLPSIYIMNADGTGITRLTAPPIGMYDDMPVALGKQVAFVRAGASRQIYSMNVDGTGLTLLTNGPYDTDPAASPRGTELAFSRSGDIYVLDLRTGGLTNITRTPEQFEDQPAYSPSGKQIAFKTQTPDGQGGFVEGIFVMNDDGTQATRLTPAGVHMYALPRWSPDGKRLAFTSNREGEWWASEIFVMNADGTGVTNLTRTPGQSERAWAWAQQ
jgi:Tol biopolymer transport system component